MGPPDKGTDSERLRAVPWIRRGRRLPDRGCLDPSRVGALRLSADGNSLTWRRARWLQFTFEVPREAARAWLPGEATRPIPAYARVFFLQGTERAGGNAALGRSLSGAA